uniref:ATP synthase F0 subunit 8 n=1 Tax=Willemoesia forceps TaxID=2600091 RepID=UPI00286B16D6|nr:ATP synthase F0 subunit 8 [Willemoesia forceps]WLW41803.1 ATP synthase F0 subunit 8 [Willemoesia forceps]
MPQMAPLLWSSLFVFFLFNLLLFLISTYFLLPPSKMKYNPCSTTYPQKNWKW